MTTDQTHCSVQLAVNYIKYHPVHDVDMIRLLCNQHVFDTVTQLSFLNLNHACEHVLVA